MAARSNNSVLDMVHWYNTTEKYGTNSCTAPAAMTYKYSWRAPTSLKKSSVLVVTDSGNDLPFCSSVSNALHWLNCVSLQ